MMLLMQGVVTVSYTHLIKDNELIKLDDKTDNLVEGVNILEPTNITEDVNGKDGKAIQFNGGTSYFKTDIESAGFGWTTAMWIQPIDTARGTSVSYTHLQI